MCIHETYERSNCSLHFVFQVLDEASEEFALIKKYVSNTHAATHSQYTLDIENVSLYFLMAKRMQQLVLTNCILPTRLVFRYLKCLERVKARGSNRLQNCPIANCCGTAPASQMWLVSCLRDCASLLQKLPSRVSFYRRSHSFCRPHYSKNRFLLIYFLGYMFGKGIYFADMVSKSANYCMTSKANPTGILLLADVALGKW